MKDEHGGKIVMEYVALWAKIYACSKVEKNSRR